MEIKITNNKFSSSGKRPSVSFSNLTRKFVFDYSFTAKLVLADEKVKKFYSEIATELLRYEGVTPKTLWSGVSFYAQKQKIAHVNIIDGKLCLQTYPDNTKTISIGTEKVKPQGEKIKSEQAKKYALTMIESLAASRGLKRKEFSSFKIDESAFKTDSFNNLVTRGLIKILRDGEGEKGIYADTIRTQADLMYRHGGYNDILTYFSEGNGYAKLQRKLMLRSVDEIWVRAIEDCIPSLDELIRNPNHFIAESEDILPIEKTKRISGRSIAHLCRHTDYISKQDDGDITPTKMLNVFREDSLLTYENKFLNTLINRLYLFVSRRYKVAKEYGVDEQCDVFELENTFTHGEGRGKVKLTVEYSEKNLNSDVKNTLLTTGLWSRVERLNDIVTGYINSSFAKEMDRNFVRPPIMRTNAIIKNKYFRECLALWEFIESYDDAGYGITVDETDIEIPSEYAKAVYSDAAMQYMLFKYHTENGFDDAEYERESVIPDFYLNEMKSEPYSEIFNDDVDDEDISGDINMILKVALAADELYDESIFEEPEATEEPPIIEEISDIDDVIEENFEYDKESFAAICNEVSKYGKENFVEICHAFLSHDGFKMRYSRHKAYFYYNGVNVAVMLFSDKSMKLYVALAFNEIPRKYDAIRESKRAFADTPCYIKIKSKRHLQYAYELADMINEKYSNYTQEYDYDASYIDYSTVSTSKKTLEKLAENVSHMAVKESSLPIHSEPVARTDENVSDDAKSIAASISNLVRPRANYDEPTEYGIDDTSTFIADENADGEN